MSVPGMSPLDAAAAAIVDRVRVAQLALPALVRMARATPPVAARFSCDKITGAALALFCVYSPSGAAGTSETISDKSSFCALRMPAYKAE